MNSFDSKSLPIPLRAVVIVLQRVWFAWCCLATLLIGLFALLFYFVIFNFCSSSKAKGYAFIVTKYWGKSLLGAMLVRLSSEGIEKLNGQTGSHIIVSNHASIVDIPVCMSTAPIPFSFLAKIEVDKLPIIGYLARNMHVYVNRKSLLSRQQTYKRMEEHLNEGHSIHIYAEGTRNKSEALLQEFYNGAFKLAIQTQRPIAVLTICNSANVSTPKAPFLACPAQVHCIWDEPISTKGMTIEEDLDYLKSIVYDRILYNLENFHANYQI
jgi:1-acyl-sn-glycerol-3-phosphate acyltransferase